MNDEELGTTWVALEPAASTVRRIDARLVAWLEARDTPLVSEWFGLFRVAPAAAFGLVTVSALWLIIASPLIWFARALM